MIEHHDLLLRLPIFFAFGFASAWFARWATQDMWRYNAGARAWIILSTAIAVIAISTLTWRADNQRIWDYFGICEAAFIVGSAAGWWFWGDNEGRNKAIFAAAAGMFLIFVALEYDIKFLDRLTKLHAGDIDFELTGAQTASSSAPQVAVTASPQSDTVAAFQRTDATDTALELLHDIGKDVVRDELFTQVLSGRLLTRQQADLNGNSCDIDPNSTDYERALTKVYCGMDASTKTFLSYACWRIEPFVGDLGALQTIHRSEISALAIDPRLLAFLRREYYLTQQSESIDYSAQQPERTDPSRALRFSLRQDFPAMRRGDRVAANSR